MSDPEFDAQAVVTITVTTDIVSEHWGAPPDASPDVIAEHVRRLLTDDDDSGQLVDLLLENTVTVDTVTVTPIGTRS